jgi:polynucleotide 5'-hydroxyl-kinase GRC3/NOL9
LELGETFYFHGAVRLLVLGGAVSLMGAHLHSSPSIHNVFAPRSHPIPSITSLQAIGSHLALGLPSRAAAIHPSATFVAIIPDISGIESLERTSSIFTGLFDLSTSLGIRHFQV